MANERFQVKFTKVIDALGRISEHWCVLDGREIRGKFDTQEKAERHMAAIKQTSYASR